MSSSTKTSGSNTQASVKPQGTQTNQMCVPHDKIAMRAYQKWQKRGCPCGTDKQDWQEAEAELKAEMARTGSTQSQQRR